MTAKTFMEKVYSKEDIKKHLEEIKSSLENDVGTALEAYQNKWSSKTEPSGFFAVPRMVFPLIDCLGSYLAGVSGDTPENSIKFIRKYYGAVDKRYKDCADFIYLIYRHGLIHQHAPKTLSYKNKIVGWQVGISLRGVGSVHLERGGSNSLAIDGTIFLKDTLKAIDLYIADFDNKRKSKKLITNLSNAFNEMNKPIQYSGAFKRWRYLKKSGFNFLRWRTNDPKTNKVR